MKNKNLKQILKLIKNAMLILILSSLFTYGIGFLIKADTITSQMVWEIGLLVVFPVIIINLLIIIPTFFVKKKWIRIFLTYLPVFIILISFRLGINIAWTLGALFFSVLIANSIWLYELNQ